MFTEICLFYVILLVDPQRIMVYGISALLVCTQYLIVSIISSFIKAAFEDIANELYGSDWYWLNKQDKRDTLKVLMLAQKPKALSIATFTEANLERFTDVNKSKFGVELLIYKLKCLFRYLKPHTIVAC